MILSRLRLLYGSPMHLVFHRLVLFVFPGSFLGLLHYNPLLRRPHHGEKNINKKMVTVHTGLCFCPEIPVWFVWINRTDRLHLMMYIQSYPMTSHQQTIADIPLSSTWPDARELFFFFLSSLSRLSLSMLCFRFCCFYDYYYYYYCSRHQVWWGAMETGRPFCRRLRLLRWWW